MAQLDTTPGIDRAGRKPPAVTGEPAGSVSRIAKPERPYPAPVCRKRLGEAVPGRGVPRPVATGEATTGKESRRPDPRLVVGPLDQQHAASFPVGLQWKQQPCARAHGVEPRLMRLR